MVNYKELFAFKLYFTPKGMKFFSKKTSTQLPDKRVCELFGKMLIADKPLKKYSFSNSVINLSQCLDLKSIHNKHLKHLKHDVGIIFCNENNLHFAYCITYNHILLVIFDGKAKMNLSYDDRANNGTFSINNNIIGSCIIPYRESNVISIPNCAIGRLLYHSYQNNDNYGSEFLNEYRKIKSEIDLIGGIKDNLGSTLDNVKKEESPYLYKERELYFSKTEKIEKAVRMFLYLKTSKTISETFISENGTSKSYNENGRLNQGIIKVDSTWNTSIDVINPFPVKGHFRNQPKKDTDGKMIKELIYIEPFIKSGYHRSAKKDKDV